MKVESRKPTSLYKNPANQYKHLDWYDSRNRLRHSPWNVSASDNAAGWNIGPETSTAYDDAGRLTSVSTNRGETTVAFGYDDANRQIWEDQTLAGYSMRRISTPRDADGNRLYLHVPGWYSVDYQYTGRNQLKAVNGFATFSYDPNGNLANRTATWIYPSGTSYFFDELNRVTQIDHGNAWFIFSRPHFQYDSVGREIATWRDEQSSKGEHFWYTASNQLAVAEYNAEEAWTASPQNCERWVGYNYTPDSINRQSVNDNGAFTTYSVSGMNQYAVSGATSSYDGNFNLTDFGGFQGVYDAENHLVGGSMQATYDGLGRCVRRTTSAGTLLFTYDGWKPILEWDSAGNWVATNVYGAGADEILARQDSAGHILIYKQDQHGNVVAVMTDNGDVTEKYTYDAFGKPKIFDKWGNERTTGTAVGNRFMFQGRDWIAELGIYDYRHRYYQPELGRFLQTDPTGFDAGDMNLFRYCGDDPVDRSDPTGLVVMADIDRRLAVFDTGSSSSAGLDDLNKWHQVQSDFRAVAEQFDAKKAEATKSLDGRLQSVIPGPVQQIVDRVGKSVDHFSPDAIRAATEAIKAFLGHRIGVGDPTSFRNNNPMRRTCPDAGNRILVNPGYLTSRRISNSAFSALRLQAAHVPSLLAHEGAHLAEPFPCGDPRGEDFARGVQKQFDSEFGVNSFRQYGSD